MMYHVTYVPSRSMVVQGKYDEVMHKYGKEWKVSPEGRGNGNWLLTKRADVLVDGKSYRSFVLDFYGRSKLTEKLVDRFREELNNGKVELPD